MQYWQNPVMIAWRNFLFTEREDHMEEMKTRIALIQDAKEGIVENLMEKDSCSEDIFQKWMNEYKAEIDFQLENIKEIILQDFSEYWVKYVDVQPVSQEILDEILEDIEVRDFESATFRMIDRYEDIAAAAEKIWEKMTVKYEEISSDSLKGNICKALMDMRDDKDLELIKKLNMAKSI